MSMGERFTDGDGCGLGGCALVLASFMIAAVIISAVIHFLLGIFE